MRAIFLILTRDNSGLQIIFIIAITRHRVIDGIEYLLWIDVLHSATVTVTEMGE